MRISFANTLFRRTAEAGSRRSSLPGLFFSAVFSLAGSFAVAGQAPPVVVSDVQKHAAQAEVPVSGSVVARHRATLSPSVAGRVQKLSVNVGDIVKAGAPLLQLDNALAQHELTATEASVAAAVARLEDANRRLQEVERLRAGQVVARTELLSRTHAQAEAQAEHERWQAEAEQRRVWLRRHQMLAPFAGVIADRHADLGEWVRPGDAVFELVSTETPWVDLQVPQQYFRSLTTDSALRLELDAFPGDVLTGRIERIVPVSSGAARTFRVRIAPQPGKLRILPGMSVRGLLQLTGTGTRLRVPRDALVRQPDGTSRIWEVETADGKTQVRSYLVQAGAAQDGWIEISGDLPSDARVVVRGNESLSEGQLVRILEQSR